MKAASLQSNGKIKIIEKSIPTIGNDECLIRVDNCGVCSSDIYRGFDNGAYFYPLVMGHEFAGKIEKLGNKVTGFNYGDAVAVFPLLPCFRCNPCQNKEYATCTNYKYYGSRNDGGFSEYMSVKSWNLFKIDSNVDLKDASMLEPLSVVVHGLKQIGIFNKKNFNAKKTCVIGCGFLGLMLSEILINSFDFEEILIIDRNDFKLDLIKSKSSVIKKRLDSEKKWNTFLKNYQGHFDYTFEMSGFSKNFNRSISLAKPKGKILWLGNIDKDLKIPKETISSVLRKELNIKGTWNSNFKNINDDWKDSYSLIKQNIIKPSKFVTESIRVEDVQTVVKKMYNHKIGKKRYNYIKYLVDLSND
jgi:L-iditol 2-dehydrogenase|tara:strand:- start:3581 stop:4657 length:1077 start_codon:yes stop_codon:yes gene_type:complete